MYIKAQPVARAVHIKTPVIAVFEDLVEAATAQAEIDHALRQHAQRGVMRFVPTRAGTGRRDCRRLRREHHFIHITLRRRVASAHWKSARNVGGIPVEFAAGINQQQIALAKGRIIADVMQHTGVGTAGDDRGISRRLRATAAKLV